MMVLKFQTLYRSELLLRPWICTVALIYTTLFCIYCIANLIEFNVFQHFMLWHSICIIHLSVNLYILIFRKIDFPVHCCWNIITFSVFIELLLDIRVQYTKCTSIFLRIVILMLELMMHYLYVWGPPPRNTQHYIKELSAGQSSSIIYTIGFIVISSGCPPLAWAVHLSMVSRSNTLANIFIFFSILKLLYKLENLAAWLNFIILFQ